MHACSGDHGHGLGLRLIPPLIIWVLVAQLDHEHPLVKGLVDSLKESNHKEVQAAAADALRKVRHQSLPTRPSTVHLRVTRLGELFCTAIRGAGGPCLRVWLAYWVGLWRRLCRT